MKLTCSINFFRFQELKLLFKLNTFYHKERFLVLRNIFDTLAYLKKNPPGNIVTDFHSIEVSWRNLIVIISLVL